MFKVNNKDTRTILILKNFTACSTISTVNFEQVNAGWDHITIEFSVSNPTESVKDMKEAYKKIDNHLHCLSEYEPILLDNNLLDISVPEDREKCDIYGSKN